MANSKKSIIFYIIFIITLAGCRPVNEQEYYGMVQWVPDGDTVKLVNGEFVRYIGIDTPEFDHDRHTAEYFAKEAKGYNQGLVDRKVVRLEFDVEKRDIYKRLLAYVYVDDLFVNEQLIKEGYARSLIIPPNIKYKQRFLQLEHEAKADKKGLWQKKK